MKWFSSPVIDFDYNGKLNQEEWFNNIISVCDDMEANDVLHIYDFGQNGDLCVDIYKDEEYKGGDEFNLVVIYVSQLNPDTKILEPVDDTEDTYVTDGSLYRELERIWNYEDYGLVN